MLKTSSNNVYHFLLDRHRILKALERCRADGYSKVVFTNGCFDILHPGHMLTLRHAAFDVYDDHQSSVLVVGINSDISVKELKGENRPINDDVTRSFMIAELIKDLGFVVIFDEKTPDSLIDLIKPDVIVKGSDYADRQNELHPGYKYSFAPYSEQYSTTKIIEKIKSEK